MKKAVLFIVILLIGAALWSQNKHALVIGNANYPRIEDILPNVINDTVAISRELQGLGYQVKMRQDLNHLDMVDEIEDFVAKLQGSIESEGFFWYGGHAVEIDGENFLMPLNVSRDSERHVKATSYSVTTLAEMLERVRNKVNVVVLDACREPPSIGGDERTRGGTTRTIKTVSLRRADLIIIYSTASGTPAFDGDGRENSPFTEAFLKHMRSTDPLPQMISHVTSDTLALTMQRQRPYYNGTMSSINAWYSLNPASSRPVQPLPVSTAVGSIRLTSEIAGEILIDGKAVGTRIREGGAVTLNNLETGSTEVAVRQDNGTIVKAPNTVRVQQGQTVAALIERPVPSNMVRIPGGTFTMGSPANEPGRSDREGPQRRVTLSSFYMGKYEVTQKEYREVIGTNPSNFKGDNLPVENVTWFDAVDYCNALSRKEGLTAAYVVSGSGDSRTVTPNWGANGYRLPTEAEWEYACRAGTTTPFSTGNNVTTNQANYNGNNPYNNNAKGTYRERTTPVGSFAANPWGLYDMHGNVLEWCWDWYENYTDSQQTDPKGPSTGSNRVMRGGSWYSSAQNVRSARRSDNTPLDRLTILGFRLVRSSN